jgi:hypothetical protein
MWFEQNSLLILVAFVIIVLVQMAMAWRKGWTTSAVRIVGITTIACLGVFAALTVSNEKNGPAVFGLLGTVGGYLLGRNEGSSQLKKEKPSL